jgi:hypothetical protein
MPVFPEELSQMEYFDYLRRGRVINDDEFNELIQLDEKIKSGIVDITFFGGNRLNCLKELFLKKRNYAITDDEYKIQKDEILNLNTEDIIAASGESDTKEEPCEEYKPISLNGTVFDAVLTNNQNLGSNLKRTILFANFEKRDFEYISFQFLLDSYRILHNFFPETFVKNRGIFISTGKTINDDSDCTALFHYDFTPSSLLESYLLRIDDGPVNLFSKHDIIEKRILVDIEYKDTNFEQYSLIYSELSNEIKTVNHANLIMGTYYKNLLYENKIFRIETEKLININIGNLFWVVPKHGINPMAIGKIINIVKSKRKPNS